MRAPALLAVCLACAAAEPASAQDVAPEITLEGAQAIEADIKIWVRNYYARQLPGTAELSMDINVRPANGYYILELRNIRIADAEFDAFEFDFGTATTELVPLENGRFETETRLSDRITFSGGGVAPLVITIADQTFTGVFAPEINNFASFDVRLDGISISMLGQPRPITIGSYDVQGEATGDDEARGDYTVFGQITDFRFETPEIRMSINEIWVDAWIGAFAMLEYMEFYGDYVEILMPAGVVQPGGMSPSQNRSLADLLERTGTLFESLDYEIGVAGLAVEEAEETFRLEQAVVRWAAGPFGPGRSSMRLDLSIGPMTTMPVEPLLPYEIELDIAALDMPNQALWDGLIAAMRVDPVGAGSGQTEQIGLDLLDALAAAETSLSLDLLHLRTPDSWLQAGGELRTNVAAVLGATGDAWVDMGGLNAYLSALAAEDGATPLIAFLTVMQTVSRQETAGQSAPYRRLEIELDDQGQVLVNGADVSPLLEGLD